MIFLGSMNILIIVNFLSNKDVISSFDLIKAKHFDLLCLIPYCLSFKRLFFVRIFCNLFKQIYKCFYIYCGNKEIGL